MKFTQTGIYVWYLVRIRCICVPNLKSISLRMTNLWHFEGKNTPPHNVSNGSTRHTNERLYSKPLGSISGLHSYTNIQLHTVYTVHSSLLTAVYTHTHSSGHSSIMLCVEPTNPGAPYSRSISEATPADAWYVIDTSIHSQHKAIYKFTNDGLTRRNIVAHVKLVLSYFDKPMVLIQQVMITSHNLIYCSFLEFPPQVGAIQCWTVGTKQSQLGIYTAHVKFPFYRVALAK